MTVIKFPLSHQAKERLVKIIYDQLDQKIEAEIAEVHAKVDREMAHGLGYFKGINRGQQT